MTTIKIGIKGPIHDLNLGGNIHVIDIMVDLGNEYPFNKSYYVQTDNINAVMKAVSGFIETNLPACANGERVSIESLT